MVYYFFKKDFNHDADNISKPVWDSLRSLVYDDDRQIKLRIAAVFDLSSTNINEIDMTNMPADVLIDLLESIEKEDHTLYIAEHRFIVPLSTRTACEYPTLFFQLETEATRQLFLFLTKAARYVYILSCSVKHAPLARKNKLSISMKKELILELFQKFEDAC